jgi:hypothetical protein
VHEAVLILLDGRISVQANVSVANVEPAALAAGGHSQNPAILQQLKEAVK